MHCLKEALSKKSNINITAGGNCLNEPTRAVEAAITIECRGKRSSFHFVDGGWRGRLVLFSYLSFPTFEIEQMFAY